MGMKFYLGVTFCNLILSFQCSLKDGKEVWGKMLAIIIFWMYE